VIVIGIKPEGHVDYTSGGSITVSLSINLRVTVADATTKILEKYKTTFQGRMSTSNVTEI